MTKNKKNILIGIAAAVILIAILSFKPGSQKQAGVTEKIDRFLGITRENTTELFTSTDAFSFEKYLREKINKDIADRNTVDLFKFLQFKFQNDNMEDHYSEVLSYLAGLYGEQKAEEYLELYKGYTQYEMGLAEQEFFKRQQPSSAAEALNLLNDIKSYRESVFGSELAENLFGDEHRMYEYTIMQNEIVKDPDMYGKEKEKEISELQENLGYKPGEDSEMSEFDKYNFKLRLYKKDLSGMSADQQKELMKKFRSEIFTPEEASRLEELEWSIEQEERRQKGIADHS